MDYEKKYKEALEVMRQWIAPCHTKEQLDTLRKSVFPELGESEDERIKEKILECVSLAGTLNDLEKVRAYLEKQKENPKTADSIPSDCVSDVKCEDRWHKVTDSLPDNGRLVLAQDCLGNTLLARYDGEGNWEVSVYDNNDYYCRNTITKWCEIPSEKQKEQKPVEYLDKEKVFDIMRQLTRLSGSDRLPLESDEYVLVDKITRMVRDLLDYPIEQKPAEWSEYDTQIIQGIINDIEYAKSIALPEGKTACDEQLIWLKSLRPQPQGTYKQIVHSIYNMLKDKDFFEIQPSHRVSLLNDIRVKCKIADECAEILDEPSWKPSEEQMKELYDMVCTCRSEDQQLLQDLYFGLKKL